MYLSFFSVKFSKYLLDMLFLNRPYREIRLKIYSVLVLPDRSLHKIDLNLSLQTNTTRINHTQIFIIFLHIYLIKPDSVQFVWFWTNYFEFNAPYLLCMPRHTHVQFYLFCFWTQKLCKYNFIDDKYKKCQITNYSNHTSEVMFFPGAFEYMFGCILSNNQNNFQ